MRIYINPLEAFKEVERDLWEMGIDVHPQTMQDKDVGNNPDYATKEVRAYGFHLVDWIWNQQEETDSVGYIFRTYDRTEDPTTQILKYIQVEFEDRVSGRAMNPGNSYQTRKDIWNEFLHDGKFAYTYSERIAPQLHRILNELEERPETRQAIINIHSNILPLRSGVVDSIDLTNIGGSSRIPCSMYYQIIRRQDKLDLIYTMRSCDFLVHFPVDIMLALRLQLWFAEKLGIAPGTFTYFTGSLHAYQKDMSIRGIF